MEVPGTASRPVSRGFRPGTANRGLLASSSGAGMRLGTGRSVPTTPGGSAVAGYGVALSTDVRVTDRPVTQQGLGGLRLGTARPGRQVQDNSFFHGKLHQKIAELTEEIERLQGEITKNSTETKQRELLEKKNHALNDEVLELQGTLADHNMAAAKARDRTDPEEIRQHQLMLKKHNEREAAIIDEIFMERKQNERLCEELMDEARELHERMEEKIASLGPARATAYHKMLEETEYLVSSAFEARSDVQRLHQIIMEKERALEEDESRNMYVALDKKLAWLKKEEEQLSQEARTATDDPEEARAIILAKVKEDKERLAELEETEDKLEAEIEEATQTLKELEIDLQGRNNGEPDRNAEKYEILQQKDREMTNFIENFDKRKRQCEEEEQRLQATIVALLEHISEDVSRKQNVPDKDRVSEMKNDLSFKQKQLQSSESTKDRLENELKKRELELSKIETLDKKIQVELQSLQEKMEQMTRDIPDLEDLDGQEEVAQKSKRQLLRLRQLYIKRKDDIKPQVDLLSNQYEQKERELQRNESLRSLENLEKKLQTLEQNSFQIKEFIANKEQQTNYEEVKRDVLKLVEDINRRVKQRLQEVAP